MTNFLEVTHVETDNLQFTGSRLLDLEHTFRRVGNDHVADELHVHAQGVLNASRNIRAAAHHRIEDDLHLAEQHSSGMLALAMQITKPS